MAARTGNVRVSITADASGLHRETRNAEKSLGRLDKEGSGSMRRLGAASKVAGAALAGGLVIETGRVVAEWREAQKAGKQTEAVLKSTGGAAGVTAKQVERLANSLSLKTGIDDEAVQSAENLLLTFTQVRNEAGKGNDIFTQSTKVITDMSVALGQDLKSSTIQVGKALNDPIKGITALQRVGVSFTEDQKAQIQTLVDSGQAMKAQKLILRELNKEFAGSAAAQADPFDKAKVAVENLEEALGGLAGPALAGAAGALATFVSQTQTGTGAGGQFRDTVVGIGRAIGGVGAAVLPAATALGGFALHAVQVAAAFGQTRTGIVLLTAALGGLAGRMVGLGALWAVGRITAFVGAIKAAILAVRGLTAATAASGIGVLAIVLGTVIGAVLGFSSSSKAAGSSVRDLTSAINAEQDALRELRDLDIASAQAKANYRSATVAVAAAEARVNQLRRSGKTHTLEFRQAEADLAQAKVGQRRATRELSDVEGNERRVRQRATEATQDRVAVGKRLTSRLADEIRGLRANVDVLRKMGATTDGTGSKSEKLRGVLHRLKAKEGELRTAQLNLNRAINDLPARKTTQIDVKVAAVIPGVGQLWPDGKVPKGGGQKLSEALTGMASKGVRERIKKEGLGIPGAALLGSLGSKGAAGVDSFTPIARRFGLAMTSGFRPGDDGWHGQNRARDFSNGVATAAEMAFARFMAKNYGSKLLELIHTPLGFGIKNGRRVPLSFWGSAINRQHYNHVHVAYRQGGKHEPQMLNRPVTRIDAGEDAPRFPEFFIPTNPKYRDRARGLLAQAAQKLSFASGGRYVSTSYGPPWGGINGGGTTATGVNLHGSPHVYGVAVDPRRIRLGSMLRIWPNPFNYRGAFKAFDTGGAIKGNRIDFYDWRGRKAQYGWGRRTVTVSDFKAGGGVSGGGAKPGKKSPGVHAPEATRNSAKRGENGLTKAEQKKLDRLDRALAVAEGTPDSADDIMLLKAKRNLQRIGLRRLLRNPKSTGEQIRSVRSDMNSELETIRGFNAPADTDGGDTGGGGGDGLDANTAALEEQNRLLEENNKRLQEIADLTKQQRDDFQKRLNVSQSEYGVLAKAIADVASGTLGGRVGLGFQSPSYAGGVARY